MPTVQQFVQTLCPSLAAVQEMACIRSSSLAPLCIAECQSHLQDSSSSSGNSGRQVQMLLLSFTVKVGQPPNLCCIATLLTMAQCYLVAGAAALHWLNATHWPNATNARVLAQACCALQPLSSPQHSCAVPAVAASLQSIALPCQARGCMSIDCWHLYARATAQQQPTQRCVHIPVACYTCSPSHAERAERSAEGLLPLH